MDPVQLQAFGIEFGALALGCVLRTVLPYITSGLQIVSEEGSWKAWPAFEPKYLASLALALIAYGVILATVPGAISALSSTSFIAATGIGYAGGDLARETIKAGSVVRMLRR